MAARDGQPETFGQVVGLVNKLQQICTQLGDTAGNSILVDKLSSIVVVGGQVSNGDRFGDRGTGAERLGRVLGHQPCAELQQSRGCRAPAPP